MTLCPDTAHWFAVQVQPQHELQVACQLQYKGFEHFLPSSDVKRRWSDRQVLIHKPLFPGYLFCRSKRSQFTTLLTTAGVYRIVGFGGRPVPVPENDIDQIHRVLNSKRILSTTSHFQSGERVQIGSGPLLGVIGVISQRRNKHRLIISIDHLMRSLSVDISSSDVLLPASD